MSQHEFGYCTAQEVPRVPLLSEHDDFAEGLELNWHDIEEYDLGVDDYAKKLSEIGRTALRDVSLPINVVDLETYRHERNAPEAA